MKKVLTFNGVYIPGYKAGGPIRSLANLVDHLKGDIKFYILTRDRDAGDIESYNNIETNKWITLTEEKVYYQKESEMSILTLRNIINSNNYDGVLLNGILSEYTVRYLLLRKFKLIKSIPTIIMPRGDLSQGALSLKNKKKLLFLKIAKIFGLYSNLEWLVTSDIEKKDSKKIFNGIDISSIPNLPKMKTKGNVTDIGSSNKEKNKLKVVYISRITKVKNLLLALKVLNKVKGNIEFNIYGPISDREYWNSCEDFISKMNENIKVEYHGSLPNERVDSVLNENDVYLLPTLGENYGHGIVEALLNGTPVIISNQTPWKNLADHGAGWDIPLENESEFVEVLEKLHDFDVKDYSVFLNSTQNYIYKTLNLQENIKKYSVLFNKVYSK